MADWLLHVSISTAVFLLFFVLIFQRLVVRSTKLPPGPLGHWISGARPLLRVEPWKTYAQWSQRYHSPIISFRLYNRVTIVLNNLETASALLTHRSDAYSDRPHSRMYNDICGRAKAVFNIPASHPRHRIYRRMLQSGLGKKATDNAQEIIRAEADILLDGLRSDQDNWQTHVRRNAAGVIVNVAFGAKIKSLDDPFILVAEESSRITGQALASGRWLVDYIPLLRFLPSSFPGAGWKRQGLVWKERLNHLSGVPHQWVKEQMEQGSHSDSLTSYFLEEIQEEQELKDGNVEDREDIVKWCAAALYAGAADTTVSALISFVLLMALYPSIQNEAQSELDRTFLDQGLPSDSNKLLTLQHLNALSKEVLRFAPVGNLALPHCASQDDEYMGYHIPKGATVIANVWAILHDSSIYPDPFSFDPSRFLRDDPNSKTPQMDPTTVAYGFGRRACPGSHFATRTMLVAMASILYHFTVECDHSEEKRDAIEFTTGITSHIKPFPIRFVPRTRTTLL